MLDMLTSPLILMLPMLAAAGAAEPVAPGVLRTPDERFEGLAEFPYRPHYVHVADYRIHYVDEGPRNGRPMLLLHGEPTWSYLYRKMIPVLTAAGYRVVAPDLVGFGRSDKPARQQDYSYPLQVQVMSELVEELRLRDVTFFGQDWGGLVGLRVVTAMPERFAAVVVSNTGLPAAEGWRGWLGYPLFKLAVWWEGAVTLEELRSRTTFVRWVAYTRHVPELPVGQLMGLMGGKPDEALERAYEAPFPDGRYKAGAHAMPYLVPSQLRENAAAWRVLERWDKPFLVAFGDADPITAGQEQEFLRRVPTAQQITLAGAGHFVQEDAGELLAQLMVEFMAGRRFDGEVFPER